MSGLLDRIFPRSDASSGSSEPVAGAQAEHPFAPAADQSLAAPAEPPASAAEAAAAAPAGQEADRATDQTGTDQLGTEHTGTDQTGVLAPLGGSAAAPGERGSVPAAPQAREGQTASMPAADAAAVAAPPLSGSAEPTDVQIPPSPGFAARARLRRRLRYLRKLHELLLRDLGGLVFDQRRFGRSREDLVAAKAERLTAIDGEIRALERTLGDHRLLELREPGVGGVCERCGAFFPSTASFCSDCGAPVAARKSLADDAAEQPAAPLTGPPLSTPTAAPPGGDLWSGSQAAHQVTPPAGFTPVDASAAGAGGTPPPPAAEAGNGTQVAKEGPSLPGGLQRPDDDAAEPPSLSSGDPLQQR